MPNALHIGLLGPLQVRDETGRPVRVGGRQLRVLLTLLALNAGRVVPAGSLAGHIWPDDPPGNPGNALQTLVSRLRAELRQGGICDVIESYPAGYRLAVPPDAVDATAFERLAGQGRHALAGGDPAGAARILREALLSWRGQPLADVAGADFADAAAARLTELRSSVLADRIEADLATGEGASLVGELRVLLSADPLAERPVPCSCARCTRPAARQRRSRSITRAASCSPTGSAWTRRPSSSRSTWASCGAVESQPLRSRLPPAPRRSRAGRGARQGTPSRHPEPADQFRGP